MRVPEAEREPRQSSWLDEIEMESEAPTRRTITITGRGAERWEPSRRHTPARPKRQRRGGRPDRIAMWAVLLGVAMAIAAATSSHAAMLAHVAHGLGH
jgi:hypothetical protein